jgi:hypothetical protein
MPRRLFFALILIALVGSLTSATAQDQVMDEFIGTRGAGFGAPDPQKGGVPKSKNTSAGNTKSGTATGGAKSPGSAFAEFRRMEDQIDGQVAEVAAHREVDDALRDGRMDADDLESKFAVLEGKSPAAGDKAASPEIDDELAALKKKIRIG